MEKQSLMNVRFFQKKVLTGELGGVLCARVVCISVRPLTLLEVFTGLVRTRDALRG